MGKDVIAEITTGARLSANLDCIILSVLKRVALIHNFKAGMTAIPGAAAPP